MDQQTKLKDWNLRDHWNKAIGAGLLGLSVGLAAYGAGHPDGSKRNFKMRAVASTLLVIFGFAVGTGARQRRNDAIPTNMGPKVVTGVREEQNLQA